MLTWLWRLIVVGFPDKPGMTALRRRQEAVEQLLDQFIEEVKAQRARIVTALRVKKGLVEPNGDAPQSPQDAPESTNPRATSYDRPRLTTGGPKAARGNY